MQASSGTPFQLGLLLAAAGALLVGNGGLLWIGQKYMINGLREGFKEMKSDIKDIKAGMNDVLETGYLILEGKTEELINNELVKKAYLG